MNVNQDQFGKKSENSIDRKLSPHGYRRVTKHYTSLTSHRVMFWNYLFSIRKYEDIMK